MFGDLLLPFFVFLESCNGSSSGPQSHGKQGKLSKMIASDDHDLRRPDPLRLLFCLNMFIVSLPTRQTWSLPDAITLDELDAQAMLAQSIHAGFTLRLRLIG